MQCLTIWERHVCRGGYRISDKGGLLINKKTSGGGRGGAVRFRPILRAGGGGGGGGCCPRACKTQGFWTKEGVVNPKNP